MMTSSNKNIFRVTGHLCGEFTGRRWMNSPHKGQWRGALMFSLIGAWINGWVNNGEAGDLRRHRTHCDITVIVHGKEHGSLWLKDKFLWVEENNAFSLMYDFVCLITLNDSCNLENVLRYKISFYGVNSSRPSGAYMRHKTRPFLVQLMVCCQFDISLNVLFKYGVN